MISWSVFSSNHAVKLLEAVMNSKIKRLYERINNSTSLRVVQHMYQSAIFLSGMIILLAMVGTVLLRYVLKINLFGMDEIILCFVFWFYFFGGANGSMEDSQIRADLVATFVKKPKAIWGLRIVTRLIEIGTLIFIIAMSVGLFVTNCQRMPATQGLKIPYIVPQSSIVVGFILMLFYDLLHLLRQLAEGPQPVESLDGTETLKENQSL